MFKSPFQSTMLGMYGSEATGINPNVVWPNDAEMDLQREYEHVLYDGLSLQEMIAQEREKQAAEKKKVLDR